MAEKRRRTIRRLAAFFAFFLRSWVYPGALVSVAIVDQLTKLWVRNSLKLGQRVPIIDGFLNLTFTLNEGIAFGIFSGNENRFKLLFFSIGAAAAVVTFCWLAAEYGEGKRYVAIAVSLLVGGTLGNSIDRLSYGAVIDFLDIHYRFRFHWPAFNVADAAVSLATLLILARIIRTMFSHYPTAKATAAPGAQGKTRSPYEGSA